MSFVVVTETSGQRQIHPVSLSPSKPVLIGRAWQNDVIVNDEYIDASHLQLSMSEDGSIKVTDLGTRNGSRLVKRRVEGESRYTLGSPIVIGDSSVVLHDTEAAVVPAQKLDTAHVASRIFNSFSWVLVATLVAAAGLIGAAYYTNSIQATSEVLTNDLMGFSIVAAVWCLLAGFVGKLFRHRTYLKLHWVLACLSISLSVVVTLLVDILRFNLDSNPSEVALVHGSQAILILLFAYATFSLSTQLGRTKKLAGACVFALLPVVFNLVNPLLAEEHERWTSAAGVNRLNQPPELFFGEPITLQAHIRKTDSLFAELDAKVKAEASDPGSLEIGNDGMGEDVQITGMD